MTHCLVNHHINGHLVFVLVSTEWFMMCAAIDNPASCEIHAISCFLHAKNMSAPEIHHEICAVYGQTVMNQGTLRQCCRMFKDGQRNVHDEKPSGQPSVVGDDFVQIIDQKICQRRCFTISQLLCGFPQIAHIVLYKIITVRLGCHQICATWVLKIFMGGHKMQRMTSALTLIQPYHKDDNEFLNHII
jgi:hypothetical protein